MDDSCIILVLCSKTCSTAGNEASGTSNMKFTMNGCLLLATLSGSNIEIQKEIGDENIVSCKLKSLAWPHWSNWNQ